MERGLETGASVGREVAAVAFETGKSHPDLLPLAAIVAAAFGLRAEHLTGESRGSATIAFARQVAMYLAHTRLGLPYLAAGASFGRDRTTAAHACRKVEERREDPRVDSILDCLERAVDLCQNLPHGHGGVS